MACPLVVPQSAETLRNELAQTVAAELGGSYSDRERKRLNPISHSPFARPFCEGSGAGEWPAVSCTLDRLQEMVMPGAFSVSATPPPGFVDLTTELRHAADCLYGILHSYFVVEFEDGEAQERALHVAMRVVARLPEIRARARWNIFASMKDPAVWDSFALRDETRRDELARLDLLAEIDRAIRARDMNLYTDFLRQQGFDYAFDYQRRLVKRAYPGWRALLMHDFAHTLAVGGEAMDGRIQAGPTPFLPRVIAEQAANVFQTDLHPECSIGDANFVEHPHRGLTLGQTGSIGVGCVIYPSTLGGVTDKVKNRHPKVGDYVLIGTDAGIFGFVEIGDETTIGANDEIYGFVTIGKRVRMGSSVVVRTVKTGRGAPGRIVFEDGAAVGDEALIINDQPNDLVIPAGSKIPPHHFVRNDGEGRPQLNHGS